MFIKVFDSLVSLICPGSPPTESENWVSVGCLSGVINWVEKKEIQREKREYEKMRDEWIK